MGTSSDDYPRSAMLTPRAVAVPVSRMRETSCTVNLECTRALYSVMLTRRHGATSQSLVTTRTAAIAMIIAVRIKNAVVTLGKSRTAPHTPAG